MRLNQEYDWVLFGSHPSQGWIANALHEMGERVLWVPLLSESRNWVPSWINSSEELLAEEVIQVITPKEVFRVYRNSEAFDAEWRRVTGKSWNQESFSAPEFADLVQGLGFLSRGHDFGSTQLEDADALKNRLISLRYTKALTHSNVLKAQWKKLQDKGIHVTPENGLQNIFLEGKKLKGVQFHGQSSMISTTHGIAGVNWDWVVPFLYPEHTGSPISAPLGWRFTMQFELPEDAVPIGATSKMVFSQAYAPAIEISKNSEMKKESSIWNLTTILPYHSVTLARDYQRKIAQRMFKAMDSVFPFLEYSAKSIRPDLRDPEIAETVDLVDLYPFRELGQITPSLLVYGGTGVGIKGPIQNFYLAYGESYPRLGEWSPYVASANALREWVSSMPKKSQKILPDNVTQVMRM